MSDPIGANAMLPSLQEFENTVRLANKGDADAIKKLRSTLDASPHTWRMLGDLGRCTEVVIMERICGGDQVALQSLVLRVEEMKIELTRRSHCLFEKLAIERVVTTWLWLKFAESELMTTPDLSPDRAMFLHKQRLQLDRLFQSAMKSLHDFQRLGFTR